MADSMQIDVSGPNDESHRTALRADGYVKISSICQNAGKSLAHWTQTEQCFLLLNKLSLELGIPTGYFPCSRELASYNPEEDEKMLLMKIVNVPISQRGVWGHPALLPHVMRWIESRPPAKGAEGYIYAITSEHISIIKIGMTRSTMKALVKRYSTYYGEDIEILTAKAGDCKRQEGSVHDEFADYRLGFSELFHKDCWEKVKEYFANLQ